MTTDMKKVFTVLSVMTVTLLTVIFMASGVSAKGNTGSADYTDALIDRVSPVIHEFGDWVDVSSLNISRSDLTDVATLLTYYGEFFNVDSIAYYAEGDDVKELYFYYNCTPQVYVRKLDKFRAAADQLLEGIAESGLSDEYKALLLHDRIAANCEYASSTDDKVVFSAYGCIINHEAVCNGYTYAYKYLLNRLGIRSDICISESMNHTWNILYINGMPYHVDVTWDDPTYDVTGRVEHDYFLLSSDRLYETRNNGATDFDHAPQDTTYDTYYWQDSSAEFQFLDGDLYFVDNKDEMIRSIRNGVTTDVISVSDVWEAGEGLRWAGNYTRLSNTGEDLLYSLSDGIYMYDLSSGSAALIHAPEVGSGDYRRIYGFTSSDSNLIYDFCPSPNYTPTTKALYQVIIPYELGPCQHNFEDGFCTRCGIPGGECGAGLIWEFDEETGTLTISGEGAMYDYDGASYVPWSIYCEEIENVVIGSGVTHIGAYTCYNCTGLTSVTIGNSVTSIGERTFYNCTGLTNVTIPDSVMSIGDWAFYNCTGLTSIIIPDHVTSVGEYAFYNCWGLSNVTIGNNVTSIGGSAFENCTGLMSITIPDSVTIIGKAAFEYCIGLKNITIGNSVTSIGNGAFEICTGLTSITIPDSVTSIGDAAFKDCSGLTSITIGNSVTSIGGGAFENCNGLINVTIPDSVMSIGYLAFFGCTNLTSVTLGSGITSIGDWAFFECNNLQSAYFEGNAPTETGSNLFAFTAEDFTIYYLAGATGWTTPTWNGYNTVPIGNYTITYNTGNEETTTQSPVYKVVGSLDVTIPDTIPVRNGYNFLGWSKTDGSTTAKYVPGSTITISDNITLYAV